jgi:hypothetical protein
MSETTPTPNPDDNLTVPARDLHENRVLLGMFLLFASSILFWYGLFWLFYDTTIFDPLTTLMKLSGIRSK